MHLIEVCVGSSCHLRGAYAVIKELQKSIAENGLEAQVELKACFCMGNCKDGVNIKLDGNVYSDITVDNVMQFIESNLLK